MSGFKKLLKRTFHPLVVFIVVQLAWLLVVVGWLYWFLGSQRKLREAAEKFRPELLAGWMDWVVLAEGLVLLATILAGVYVIFLYWSRQAALLREQKAFIAQVSHELKSPVASIQLHLETLKLRQPPPEQFCKSLAIMLEETGRLNALINNLLTANRLDFRRFSLTLRLCDLSQLTADYFREATAQFPPQGTLALSIEPGLVSLLDPESFQLIFRNLMENALLYAEGPPHLSVTVRRDGKWCRLSFADRGRGIVKKDLKKVFRIFYRVRKTGDNIRGTGLGLFIVQLLVKRQRGKVWAESEGLGRGTVFHILLPRYEGPMERTEAP
ncbi:MAG: HAMP domain-containing histidine kinase [Deltaproteobacteria bacterium]|nr:HAMP domain-containing histidine kinase [Deltaproteobacteria bacterium]